MTALRYYEITRQAALEAKTGNPVLGIEGSPVVAAAHTQSPKARVWDIIDADAGTHLCQARGVREARTILIEHARARNLEPTGRYDR